MAKSTKKTPADHRPDCELAVGGALEREARAHTGHLPRAGVGLRARVPPLPLLPRAPAALERLLPEHPCQVFQSQGRPPHRRIPRRAVKRTDFARNHKIIRKIFGSY